MKQTLLALAMLLSLPSLALAQAPVPQETQDELTVVVDQIEVAVFNQDTETLSSLFAPGLDPIVADEIITNLTSVADVESFMIGNLNFEAIDEAHVRVNSNYSIEVRGPNGNWNKSGLGVYFVFEETDGSYLISDTNLNKAVGPIDIAGFFSDYGALIGGIMLFMLISSAFWIWMLIDLIQRDVPNKPLWVIVLVFTGVLGAIIYFFAIRMPHKKSSSK